MAYTTTVHLELDDQQEMANLAAMARASFEIDDSGKGEGNSILPISAIQGQNILESTNIPMGVLEYTDKSTQQDIANKLTQRVQIALQKTKNRPLTIPIILYDTTNKTHRLVTYVCDSKNVLAPYLYDFKQEDTKHKNLRASWNTHLYQAINSSMGAMSTQTTKHLSCQLLQPTAGHLAQKEDAAYRLARVVYDGNPTFDTQSTPGKTQLVVSTNQNESPQTPYASANATDYTAKLNGISAVEHYADKVVVSSTSSPQSASSTSSTLAPQQIEVKIKPKTSGNGAQPQRPEFEVMPSQNVTDAELFMMAMGLFQAACDQKKIPSDKRDHIVSYNLKLGMTDQGSLNDSQRDKLIDYLFALGVAQATDPKNNVRNNPDPAFSSTTTSSTTTPRPITMTTQSTPVHQQTTWQQQQQQQQQAAPKGQLTPPASPSQQQPVTVVQASTPAPRQQQQISQETLDNLPDFFSSHNNPSRTTQPAGRKSPPPTSNTKQDNPFAFEVFMKGR